MDPDIEAQVAQLKDLLREAREMAWNEGRESLAKDMARPVNKDGFRASTPNPYTKH